MLAKTHMAFGIFIGILTFPFVGGNKIIFFGLVLLGSLLPDIDSLDSKISRNIPVLPSIISTITKHRGIFHTLFIAALFSAALYYTLGKHFAFALFIGYTSHLLIDGFTKKGVNLFHPVSRLNISGFVETGTIIEWILFIVLIVSIALIIL
ncbi:hypothetical protein GF336_06990 [Candidatus Woesearchaeota archaeon]|nr:hypothetical protein [Candidatus Woesearchaeota archaeon]